MARPTGKSFVSVARGGHFFFVLFDPASRAALVDYLMDLAEDPELPFTWQDLFEISDALNASRPAGFGRFAKVT